MFIVFLHPDLGIGGAERAVVDAAMAAKHEGYQVEIVTNFHDPNHAFEETVNGSLKATTVCNWLPRSSFGRFVAFWSFLKMILAAFWVVLWRRDADVVFVDQVSAPLPLLKLFGFRTIFYGHFPDLLLSSRKTTLKRLYRYPFDKFEEITTAMADSIVVNSRFTGSVFKQTFSRLERRSLNLLYPVPNTDNLILPNDVYVPDQTRAYSTPNATLAVAKLTDILVVKPKVIFLSINRYERKKNISLAVESFSLLMKNWSSMVTNLDILKPDVFLVHAGGHDSRVAENVRHYEELKSLAEELQVSEQVILLRSIPSDVKSLLFAASSAVIYTPDREHFGIVPIEAMYLGRPVIALDSGGPRETIVDKETGFLCQVSESAPRYNSEIAVTVAGYMSKFINDPELSTRMGIQCHRHVEENFSTKSFRKQFRSILEDVLTKGGELNKDE